MYFVLAAIGFLALVQGQTETTIEHSTPMSSTILSEVVSSTTLSELVSGSTTLSGEHSPNPDLTTTTVMTEKPDQCPTKDDKCYMAYKEAVKVGKQLDKLNKTLETIKDSTVRDLAGTCNIELTSVSLNTPQSTEVKKGHIMVNDMLATECNNQVSGENAMAGLSICVIDPTLCKPLDCRHFNTYNADMHDEADYFWMYTENLPDRMTIVGISCGDSVTGLGRGKMLMKKLNATVDDVQKGGKFVFVVQTKQPWKGCITKEAPGDTPLTAKFTIEGKDTYDYHFKKV